MLNVDFKHYFLRKPFPIFFFFLQFLLVALSFPWHEDVNISLRLLLFGLGVLVCCCFFFCRTLALMRKLFLWAGVSLSGIVSHDDMLPFPTVRKCDFDTSHDLRPCTVPQLKFLCTMMQCSIPPLAVSKSDLILWNIIFDPLTIYNIIYILEYSIILCL